MMSKDLILLYSQQTCDEIMSDLTPKKLAFAQQLLQKNIALTISDLNLAIKQKFGEGVRLDALVALKRDVKAGIVLEIPVVNTTMLSLLRGLYDLFLRNVTTMTDISDADIALAEQTFSLLETMTNE
jgi:hypothetical protein